MSCQCFDIEITIMAKSFLWHNLNGTNQLTEQIDFIHQHGNINLHKFLHTKESIIF